jgi:hypothetical protein
MAKITTSALIDSISGKVGNVIFRGSDLGRQVYTAKPPKRNPTQAQLLVRNAVQIVRVAWSNLSEEDRNSWLQLALLVRTNRGFNGQYPRRAYGLFHDMNFWPAYCGLNMVYTAPSWPLAKSKCSATCTVTTLDSIWSGTALQTGATDGLAVFMAAPVTTINRRSTYLPFRIFNWKVNQVGFNSPLGGYDAIFPPPVIGQQVRVKTVCWSTLGFPYQSQDDIITVYV